MSLYLDLYRVYTPSCTVDFHVQRSMQRKFSESCTQIRHRSERYSSPHDWGVCAVVGSGQHVGVE